MSPRVRNSLLLTLGLVILGFAGWRVWSMSAAPTLPPGAALTRFECSACRAQFQYTDQQLADALQAASGGPSRAAQGGGLRCPQCGAFAAARAADAP